MKTLRDVFDNVNQAVVNAQCELASGTDAGRECGKGQGARVIRLREMLADAEWLSRELYSEENKK